LIPELQTILVAYWSTAEIQASLIILMNMAGAFALGILMGYERVYHGRAAGLRTYSIVCMAACGLTIICGFPNLWFAGRLTEAGAMAGTGAMAGAGAADPTRVIQGIVTGIGFLGAGVIMREGQTIRGLSTAASIWMAAAIGVIVGLGFYPAAIVAALLTTFAMASFRQLEALLPHYDLIKLVLTVTGDGESARVALESAIRKFDYEIKDWSFAANRSSGQAVLEWMLQSDHPTAQQDLVRDLETMAFVIDYRISPIRD
jgi:putative Mg2+ transporter-C (MgtC) family protein